MRKEQERLYELLDDIDRVCRESKMCYYLIGKELLWNGSSAKSFRCSADICMTLRAYRCISDKLTVIPGRVIEDISSNTDMPGVYFRFVDTESLMIDSDFRNVLRESGIAVNIHIIRNNGGSAAELERLECIMDLGIEGVKRKVKVQAEKDFLKLKCSPGYRDTIYKLLEESAFVPEDMSSSSSLKFPGEDKIEFPSGFWKTASHISVLGRKYMTVSDKNAYLDIHFGDHISITPPSEKFPGKVIYDADLPYREVADEIIKELDDRDYLESRESFYKDYFDEYEKLVRERSRLDDYMHAAAERILLWKHYFPHKKKVMLLYRDKRFDELMLVFAEMDEQIKKYERSGYLCVFDKEIWDIYLETLEIQGETLRAGKLRRLYTDNPFKELENTEELEYYINNKKPPVWRNNNETR